MGKLTDDHRAYCLEQVRRRPGAFSTACQFLPAGHLDMLTTTEALFCVLGEIPNSVSDPSVGMVKLHWWRQELLHKPIDESAHPLVNALRETGADRHLNRALLDDYLVGLSMSIDPDPVADEVGLFEHLSSTGGLEIPLFVGVQKTHPAFPALLRLGVATSLLRLLLGCAAVESMSMAWVPMEFRAIAGDSASTRTVAGQSGAKEKLIHQLAQVANGWFQKGHHELQSDHSLPTDWRVSHVMVMSVLHQRMLNRMQKNPMKALEDHSNGIGFTDVLAAWRQARRSVPK